MTTKAAQKISLWEFFQQLGKTFMLPVALLSFCGIMLGIGSSLSSHDVITLIPFLGNPVLQAIFIWRLLSLLTKWLDVGLMCGNFCYVAAIRFVMCNELTSFRGNFMPHPCPTSKLCVAPSSFATCRFTPNALICIITTDPIVRFIRCAPLLSDNKQI